MSTDGGGLLNPSGMPSMMSAIPSPTGMTMSSIMGGGVGLRAGGASIPGTSGSVPSIASSIPAGFGAASTYNNTTNNTTNNAAAGAIGGGMEKILGELLSVNQRQLAHLGTSAMNSAEQVLQSKKDYKASIDKVDVARNQDIANKTEMVVT